MHYLWMWDNFHILMYAFCMQLHHHAGLGNGHLISIGMARISKWMDQNPLKQLFWYCYELCMGLESGAAGCAPGDKLLQTHHQGAQPHILSRSQVAADPPRGPAAHPYKTDKLLLNYQGAQQHILTRRQVAADPPRGPAAYPYRKTSCCWPTKGPSHTSLSGDKLLLTLHGALPHTLSRRQVAADPQWGPTAHPYQETSCYWPFHASSLTALPEDKEELLYK